MKITHEAGEHCESCSNEGFCSDVGYYGTTVDFEDGRGQWSCGHYERHAGVRMRVRHAENMSDDGGAA